MESGKLQIIIHNGVDLKDVKYFGTMDPYVVVRVVGDGNTWKYKTNISTKGDTDPVWNYKMQFDDIPMKKSYFLLCKIKHGGKLVDRRIGHALIPFSDLLAGDASAKEVGYCVLTPSGDLRGQIIISHKFEKKLIAASGSSSGNGKVAGDAPEREYKDTNVFKKEKRVKNLVRATTMATHVISMAVDIMDI